MWCHPLSSEYLLCRGKKTENVDEECQLCPNGKSSNYLGSYWYYSNAATDYSEAASAPTVISDTPSQSNPTNEIRYKPIQAQSGGGLEGSTKNFIIMVSLTVPATILYTLRGAYVRKKESKESGWIQCDAYHWICGENHERLIDFRQVHPLICGFSQRFFPNSILLYTRTWGPHQTIDYPPKWR